jgi:hypothetical protein
MIMGKRINPEQTLVEKYGRHGESLSIPFATNDMLIALQKLLKLKSRSAVISYLISSNSTMSKGEVIMKGLSINRVTKNDINNLKLLKEEIRKSINECVDVGFREKQVISGWAKDLKIDGRTLTTWLADKPIDYKPLIKMIEMWRMINEKRNED